MEEKDVLAELSSIRNLMERSSKFISLSGLAGIMAGVYALVGAWFAFRIIDSQSGVRDGVAYSVTEPPLWPLVIVALIVFVLSGVTAFWLTLRKAKIRKENVWNPVSRRMLEAIAIPMITGGIFIALLVMNNQYNAIASAMLIFYGLALVAGSQYTYSDVKWLGLGEIVLGLLALIVTGYGVFIVCAFGFGLLHILYGIIMYYKYER